MWLSIFALVVSTLALGYSIYAGYRAKKIRKELLKADQNVEWHGPDVCLSKKNYPEMKDDFREKVEDEKD